MFSENTLSYFRRIENKPTRSSIEKLVMYLLTIGILYFDQQTVLPVQDFTGDSNHIIYYAYFIGI